MPIGIWILGDQLTDKNPAILASKEQKRETLILMIESLEYVKKRRYHKQKLVFIWAAMRHFAQKLSGEGWQVDYVVTQGDFAPIVHHWIRSNKIAELRIMLPADRPFFEYINSLGLKSKITWYNNINFLWQPEEFREWAEGRKRLILEDFYREGRKRWKILLTEEGKPVGGKWNLDKENRKPPNRKILPPKRLSFEPDEITKEVIEKVKKLDIPTYGELERFEWGVTRESALKALRDFVKNRLQRFGIYQDAMLTGEQYMWHSLLSPYLNVGLLQPLEVIKEVENVYYQNSIPINSVEGFIRQVLGWREYMYGVYHYVEKDYFQSNWFNHTQPLPPFFWDSNRTDLNCLKQVLKQTENTAYAHHIQRLMILSNYALISGICPQEVENWFHCAYIDAYDWVMQTNVLGMGQFADGGFLATKPYISSANYIRKMSDYCDSCRYNPQSRSTENACPFNYLYWDFLARHKDKLKSQGRMALALKHLENISPQELQQIQTLATKWRGKQYL
ncbi:MAG: cryptochrome/photolyase family protein [Geminocystis sp.]|nr:cryptochrome/photolyase family protein [Geminocystis sp.]HIK38535.1 cryptochrome/photolyase family protein [Geminocystis sp. M7585_C2015_104]MCS7147376.1 cryptochrome/photolyase family protein [Geminocystis sp.]MCX8079042.1 cryptochrome/photolyase family protein [Geminocystis sp.]MDW8117066.1 cryptochrome/photolyase family protein [Geminocystis sp.]